MLDRETAMACADAISSAIAALSEQCVEHGATRQHIGHYAYTAGELNALAADIGVLAQALAVIARRASK